MSYHCANVWNEREKMIQIKLHQMKYRDSLSLWEEKNTNAIL